MRDKSCCFTGHRSIPPEQYEYIALRLESEIITLIKQGVLYFKAGGALGFDTMAAQAVLKLKPLYPQIKLILVLPCKTQAHGWHEADIVTYEQIKAACDQYIYTADVYARGCMHKRNRYLVENSGYCVCYLVKNSGGTAYTVQYAKKNRLKIKNLAE